MASVLARRLRQGIAMRYDGKWTVAARELQMPQSVLQSYLHGDARPSYDNLVALGVGLNLSLDFLAGRTNNPLPGLGDVPIALPSWPESALTREELESMSRLSRSQQEQIFAAWRWIPEIVEFLPDDWAVLFATMQLAKARAKEIAERRPPAAIASPPAASAGVGGG